MTPTPVSKEKPETERFTVRNLCAGPSAVCDRLRWRTRRIPPTLVGIVRLVCELSGANHVEQDLRRRVRGRRVRTVVRLRRQLRFGWRRCIFRDGQQSAWWRDYGADSGDRNAVLCLGRDGEQQQLSHQKVVP